MARTRAHAIRWVKLALPMRLRFMWPLMIRRLASSILAGMSRKLVAVGTPRLASMFSTMRAEAPRSGSPGTSPTSAGVAVVRSGDGRCWLSVLLRELPALVPHELMGLSQPATLEQVPWLRARRRRWTGRWQRRSANRRRGDQAHARTGIASLRATKRWARGVVQNRQARRNQSSVHCTNLNRRWSLNLTLCFVDVHLFRQHRPSGPPILAIDG